MRRLPFILMVGLATAGCQTTEDLYSYLSDELTSAVTAFTAGDQVEPDELTLLAEGGDVEAQKLLGARYLKGRGVKDRQTAWSWYRRAAGQGDAEAQYVVGSMYGEFFTLKSHVDRAIEWYLLAARQDHAPAQAALGFIYRDVRPDRARSEQWLARAAGLGNARAARALEAIRAEKKRASKKAAAALARRRAEEEEARKKAEEERARKKAEAAAKKKAKGSAAFLDNLGRAEAGDASAQYQVALAYQAGLGIPGDAGKALTWYRAAAKGGHAGAQFRLGGMYKSGKGLEVDLAQAVKWIAMAAEGGDDGAQYTLAGMLEAGDGVPMDVAKAVEWHRRAAEQGNHYAQKALAGRYMDGQGVEPDDVQAYKWLEIGISRAPQGPMRESTEKSRQNLAALMSDEDIAEARRQARAWRPKPETKAAAPAPPGAGKAADEAGATGRTVAEPPSAELIAAAGKALPRLKGFFTEVAAAADKNDLDGLDKLTHPSWKKCVTDASREFMASERRGESLHGPHGDFVIEAKPYTQDRPMYNPEALYPSVAPTHMVHFEPAGGGDAFAGATRLVTWEDGRWWLVRHCPTAKELFNFEQMAWRQGGKAKPDDPLVAALRRTYGPALRSNDHAALDGLLHPLSRACAENLPGDILDYLRARELAAKPRPGFFLGVRPIGESDLVFDGDLGAFPVKPTDLVVLMYRDPGGNVDTIDKPAVREEGRWALLEPCLGDEGIKKVRLRIAAQKKELEAARRVFDGLDPKVQAELKARVEKSDIFKAQQLLEKNGVSGMTVYRVIQVLQQ